jgi:hypothetical protein
MNKTQEIPLPRILVEGLVIIASILLALAADAWWDGVQARGEEREILKALRAEFETNQNVIAQTAKVHRMTLSAMREIVMASESEVSAHDVSMDELFRLAGVTPHYNPATGALTALINSGRIVMVRNLALRNRLAGWNAVVSDLVLDEQTRRDFVVHELHPVFAEFGIGGSVSVTKGTETDFTEALKSRQLLAHLRSQIVQVAHLITHFDDVEYAVQAITSDLSEELESH